MNPVLEFLVLIVQLCWLLIVAIVRRIAYALGLLPCKDISGEVVLITGAASGIGRLMAIDFAKRNATVVIWDLNEEGAKSVADEIRSMGREAFSYRCDIAKREEVYRVADEVRADVGDVTILVNNAGIVTGRKFMDCSDSLIQKTMEVNTMSHFWTLKAFLPKMMENNHGHVVTIASLAGHIATAGLLDYNASKFAAVGIDESLRSELYITGKTGVKTTVVCPFFISTGMFEGVKLKISFPLSILTPEVAVERIMYAVLTDKPILVIPWHAWSLIATKVLFPLSWSTRLGDAFGMYHYMDNFVQTRPKQA